MPEARRARKEFGRPPSPRTSPIIGYIVVSGNSARPINNLLGTSAQGMRGERECPCLPCRVTWLTGHLAEGGGSGATAPSQYQKPMAASTCRALVSGRESLHRLVSCAARVLARRNTPYVPLMVSAHLRFQKFFLKQFFQANNMSKLKSQ